MSRIVDLSQVMENSMPQYPGHPAARFELIAQVETEGFQMTDFHSVVHTGTHCDAPAHFIAGGETMEDVPLDRFVGDAVVIDVTNMGARELDETCLAGYDVRRGDIVLFCSGTDRLWGKQAYTTQYPTVAKSLANALVNRGVKAIGLDYMTPDPIDTETAPAHHILLGNQLGIIENLRGMQEIVGKRVFFAAAPIKVKGSDGAFARAFAIVD